MTRNGVLRVLCRLLTARHASQSQSPSFADTFLEEQQQQQQQAPGSNASTGSSGLFAPGSAGGLFSQSPVPLEHSAPGSASGGGIFVTPQVNTNDAALRTWRTAHNEQLKAQGATALKRADEELAKAKVELDAMNAEWEAKKKAQLEKNIADEKKFLAQQSSDKGETKVWARVGRYVDLNKDTAEGSKDTNRMREVILSQCKQ